MFWTYLTTILLLLSGAFLMLIVLLQRGRGGGLAGAFGGMGGQSAFGTKAGDVFTKVTIGVAVFWVIMAGVTGFAMREDAQGRYQGGSDAVPSEPTISAPEDDDASQATPKDDGNPFEGEIEPGTGADAAETADEPQTEPTPETTDDAAASEAPSDPAPADEPDSKSSPES